MIPKKIHYCWFGRGEKPKLAKKCIASWKKHCPDYEIIEWNEDNFDVNMMDYTKFAYENRCYAFLSDYVRLWAVYNHGGIYLDTDVELIRSPDELLKYEAYFGFEGEWVNTGLGFGAQPNNAVVLKLMEEYEKREPEVYREDYRVNHKMTGSPTMNTNALLPLGLAADGSLQRIGSATVFSEEYLCPFNTITGELNCTDKTVSIHWYGNSANSKLSSVRLRVTRPIHRALKKLGIKSYES